MQGYVLTFYLLTASLALVIGRTKPPNEIFVGGKRGWHVPDTNDTDAYNHWAERMRFRVGDSIRFEYQDDSVLVVDKYGYHHCKTDGPMASFDDGNNTVITLEQPGFIYFISGDYDHCNNGQRMIVDVMSTHTRSHYLGPVSPDSGPWATSSGPAPVSAQVAATFIVSIYASVFAFI